jgi:hypothetical protein
MAKRAGEELEVSVALCVGRAKSGLEKVALVMTLEELQEADAARELAREILWTQGLLKCAPKLSGGDGSYRDAKLYGMASDYGRLHSPVLSPKEFYGLCVELGSRGLCVELGSRGLCVEHRLLMARGVAWAKDVSSSAVASARVELLCAAWVVAGPSPKNACFRGTPVNTFFFGEQATATAAALW